MSILVGALQGSHRGNGYGVIKRNGLQILDFYVANKLVVASIFFQKNISRLIMYSFRGNQTQID